MERWQIEKDQEDKKLWYVTLKKHRPSSFPIAFKIIFNGFKMCFTGAIFSVFHQQFRLLLSAVSLEGLKGVTLKHNLIKGFTHLIFFVVMFWWLQLFFYVP